MMRSENPVYFQLPVFEPRFTSNDLDELLSFFQPTIRNAADVEDPSEPIAEEMDDKRKRRKISNRESARRSRLRKKKYVENLKDDLNRLKAVNREYKDRLTMVLNRLHFVKTQNELMRFESVRLIQRHTDLNRVSFVNNLNSGRFMNES